LVELAALQARLLANVATRVKPGGRLVYAVCTLTRTEGPDQVAAFVRDHPEFAPDGERITLPHRDGADGFFLARLRRAAGVL
jgi:16S rRNA (cytosine967-C5)-methyltransferase